MKFRLEQVVWQDAFGVSAAWESIDGIVSDALMIDSVGWVIDENKHQLVLCPHVSSANHAHSSQQGCGDMTIPKRSIIKRTVIKGHGVKRG